MPPLTPTPYIPQYITVHMGAPSANAENVTVSFPDYIKNVVSSEIYPTWHPSAIRANTLAIISFALNRVYTEFYPSQGYPFQITSSTAYDQKFIPNRNIFENISQLVDEIFNTYIRRTGFVEPLSAKFCNGTTTTCDGLSQWGSQALAEQGYNSLDILRTYYGNDIELVVNAPVRGIETSAPSPALRLGDQGTQVAQMQVMLNRISQDYPAIPKIPYTTGYFTEDTENSVKTFQRIFSLTPDGIVGTATWYRMVYLYVGITRLSELASQGQTYYRLPQQSPNVLQQGDYGDSVRLIQYILSVISEFYDTVPAVAIDGTFGAATTNAVIAFQRMAGLPQDGVIGAQTWEMLYRTYAGIVNTTDRYTNLLSESVRPIPPESEPNSLVQFPGFSLRLGNTDSP